MPLTRKESYILTDICYHMEDNEKEQKLEAIIIFPDDVNEREPIYKAYFYYKNAGRLIVKNARYIKTDEDAMIKIEAAIKKKRKSGAKIIFI